MIQRKQSLFLLLSVLLFAATYYFPFGTLPSYELFAYRTLEVQGALMEGVQHYYFAMPMSIAATITLMAIFMYGKRQRQMAVIRLTFVLYAISFVLMVLYFMNAAQIFGDGFKPGISFFLAFASFFLNILAVRAIKQDDRLVKSADRIR